MRFRARYALLVYVICIGTATLVWNRLEGNLIQDWYRIGGGNLRVGTEFATFATILGIWVYPFSAICACLFLLQIRSETTTKARVACIARAVVCLAFLSAFAMLGVGRFVREW